MLAHEGAAAVVRRKIGSAVEDQPERCDVRTQRVVRRDGLRDQVRPLRHHARVEMLAVVTVGPAIEGAVLDGSQVVGHQVRTELVALVDDRPEDMRLRLELQSIGVAQAGGELAVRAGGTVDLPDRCAADLGLDPVLGDVAVGAHARIELRAVGACGEALGPVVVDRSAGQIAQLYAGRGDLRLPGL